MKDGIFAVLSLAMSAYSFWTVAVGVRTGRIEPFSRGWPGELERADYPRGFWVAVAWNSAFGLLCAFLCAALLRSLQGI